MLGGDPRKDSIYFAMTARFNDGDAANNRGGNQHTSSGNAANEDPMIRGDFKGLADKLDYIKGLGFSAIWITPVVMNRSDYDYHGYHGWDFYEIDPRLESEGVSYQQLIIGVTGSFLVGACNARSDIDLVCYGPRGYEAAQALFAE